MDTLMLSLISESIQRDYRQFATRQRLVGEYGLKRCPNWFNALLARIGGALSHAGARLEHRSECGCPEQGSPAPVA